ncbi:MAG: TolC family protein [Candidatus Omnitrophota bacterium]|jgi:outer membrane protein TolC
MKNIIVVLLIAAFLPASNGISFASDVKMDREMSAAADRLLSIASGGQKTTLRMTLVDVIAYALKSNSEIKIEGINPRLKKLDVSVAGADFEPEFNAEYMMHYNAETATSGLAGAAVSKMRDIDLSAGLSGKLVTGTEYALEFIGERYKTNSSYQSINPYYASEPKLTITQPVLKDAGIAVNKADIMIAQNNETLSEQSFKNTVMDIVTKAKSAYYNYIYYRDNYSIAASSLKRAKDLAAINKLRYGKGLISSVDLLETETAVSQREKALISAESSLKKAEDELKVVTNIVDDPFLWNAEIKALDMPEYKKENPDLVASLQNAFIARPDYQQARLDLKNRDIRITTAKNALYPEVDLVGSFGMNGLGGDYQESLDKIGPEYKDWSLGVKFSMPWGSGDRAKYEQVQLEKAQALIAFKRLEQNIILDVRDKVREVDIQYRQVAASELSMDKEKTNYEAQEERYAAGQVSTHDMLDYQDALAQAELDYTKALIDYNIAGINLEKAEGLTLERNDIILQL